jgi:hypothetical protein
MGEYTQSTPGVPGASENGDHFGWSLAVGDFDGDGIDEIAVGSPGENLESPDIPDVGAVTILDLSGGNHDLILQSEIPPQEPPEQTDSFGYRLVAADFDADGVTDLAIGTQSEDVGGLVDVGIVHELFGSEGSGLDVASATTWHQTLMEEEDNDNFGASLAAGRFSGHSGSDLAIGVPGKTVFGNVAAGAVNVFYSVALFLDGFENGLDPWSDTEP